MDLEEIKNLVDDAQASTDATREEAADMLVFSRITQWDDQIGADTLLEFRGTFDYIKPKRNRILKDLWSNPVDIVFKPKDGTDPEAAETLTGMFRADMQRSEEARETAIQDQVDCGMGAFRFTTEYESKFDDLNNYQRINMEPISEANNVVYFDSNAKLKDKSDARWCAIVTTFTEKGWERFCEENDIDYSKNERPTPFKQPERTNVDFWRSKDDEIKVAEFYYKERKRERVLMYEDPLGQVKAVYQKEVKDVIDEMEAAGFIKIGEKMKERWIVEKYIVTGSDILKEQRIPGEHIPVIPVYGDWSRVEGREIWRGIYHDAQDAQRLINWGWSYYGDIVAKGPREKPLVPPGMIQGHEYMWHQSGSDDNYPFRFINDKDEDGQPYGPIQYLQNPQPPAAVVGMLQGMRQSIDDVTGGQMDSEQMMSGAVTEGQIKQAMSSLENEAFLFQNSFALAMKQAGRVYASMASELYDVPREVTVQGPDGSERTATIMEAVYDEESGEEVILNDISSGSFDVYADIGPSFQSQRDEAKAKLEELYKAMAGTPMGEIVLMTYFTMLEGPNLDHLREYARKQLILQGIMEPESEEEQMMVQQAAQQGQQPSADMIFAMAEQQKAQNQQAEIQGRQALEQMKLEIDAYEAETGRTEAMAKLRESLAKVEQIQAQTGKVVAETYKTGYEIRGTEIDNLQKALMPRGMREG